MKNTFNNMTDRKTFISRNDSNGEMSHTNNILDRDTFIRPENRNMRNELLERHSKIGTQEKSKIGVEFLEEDERVKSFGDFQNEEPIDK